MRFRKMCPVRSEARSQQGIVRYHDAQSPGYPDVQYRSRKVLAATVFARTHHDETSFRHSLCSGKGIGQALIVRHQHEPWQITRSECAHLVY